MGHAKSLLEAFKAAGKEFPHDAVPLVPYLDVVLWAEQHRTNVTVEAICARWNVCRATAYRWHAGLYGSLEEVGQRSVRGPRRGAKRQQLAPGAQGAHAA